MRGLDLLKTNLLDLDEKNFVQTIEQLMIYFFDVNRSKSLVLYFWLKMNYVNGNGERYHFFEDLTKRISFNITHERIQNECYKILVETRDSFKGRFLNETYIIPIDFLNYTKDWDQFIFLLQEKNTITKDDLSFDYSEELITEEIPFTGSDSINLSEDVDFWERFENEIQESIDPLLSKEFYDDIDDFDFSDIHFSEEEDYLSFDFPEDSLSQEFYDKNNDIYLEFNKPEPDKNENKLEINSFLRPKKNSNSLKDLDETQVLDDTSVKKRKEMDDDDDDEYSGPTKPIKKRRLRTSGGFLSNLSRTRIILTQLINVDE